VLLLAIYAMLVWALCFRFRRRLAGFVAWVAGVVAAATIAVLDRKVRVWLGDPDDAFSSMQMVLWAEVAIVSVMGLFIWAMPRRPAPEFPCKRCGYDLAGLETSAPTCPECGGANARVQVQR
jgi:hypothetical protein